jgi:4a-hydroxytetrahydrobiopterin dehydratase
MAKLSIKEIDEALQNLIGWRFIENTIQKEFIFKNFIETMAIINKIAIIAEEMNHHPEWHNVYNKLNIKLTTHDSNGITIKDIKLAHEIDILNNLPSGA